MSWSECVIDATMGARDGLFTFCPIEGDINGDYQIVTGMSFVGAPPSNMKVVAIVHEDGQDAPWINSASNTKVNCKSWPMFWSSAMRIHRRSNR